jgi:hypothetical protein
VTQRIVIDYKTAAAPPAAAPVLAEQGAAARAAEAEAVKASGGAEASSSQEWSTMLLLDAFARRVGHETCAAPAGPHHQSECVCVCVRVCVCERERERGRERRTWPEAAWTEAASEAAEEETDALPFSADLSLEPFSTWFGWRV